MRDSIQPSSINQETVTPQLNSGADVSISSSEGVKDSIQSSSINQETVTPQLDHVSDISPSNTQEVTAVNPETVSPKLDNNVSDASVSNSEVVNDSNQQRINPKLNSIYDLPSLDQVGNKNNSSYKSKNGNPIAPFSFIQLSPKAVHILDNNNHLVEKKQEYNFEHSLTKTNITSTDVITSKPETNNNFGQNIEPSVPDSWSNISELLNNSSEKTSNSSFNIDNKQINPKNESNINNSNKLNKSIYNNEEIDLINIPKNNNFNNDNLDFNQLQLKVDRSNNSGYQYQSINHKSDPPEKPSSNIPAIIQTDDYSLSPKSEISVEPENLNNQEPEKEGENTSNETELLDILAAEIYNLLQQRIENERERQGQYYR